LFRRIAAYLLLFCNLCLILCLFVAALDIREGTKIPLPIIMYHHIHSSPDRWGAYVVSPDTFEEDLRYLRSEGYETVSIKDLLAFVEEGAPLPEKPIMLSFDDGHASFQAYALPLLEKYDMCAVIAVVGAYTDASSASEDHNISYAYLSWEELQALHENSHVEIISHSYNMHENSERVGCMIYAGESSEHYRVSLNQDAEQMEAGFLSHLGEIPIAFAYPFGAACSEAQELLRDRGYQLLFTCRERVNYLSGAEEELLSLGRFNRPNYMSSWEFFHQFES